MANGRRLDCREGMHSTVHTMLRSTMLCSCVHDVRVLQQVLQVKSQRVNDLSRNLTAVETMMHESKDEVAQLKKEVRYAVPGLRLH